MIFDFSTLIFEDFDEFWKNHDNDERFKLIVYDAVIRAKLVYGLEGIKLTKSMERRIDTFHKKGLRKIIKMNPVFDDIDGHPVNPSDVKRYEKTNTMFGILPIQYPKQIIPQTKS